MTPTIAHAFRHRVWVLALVLAACLLAGLGYVRVSKPTYQAQANLLVDARWEGASDPDAALRASDTLTQLYIAEATSQGLLQQVIDTNRSTLSVAALAKRLSIGTIHGTTMIAIKATAGTPQDAATIANAVAQGLVDRNSRDVESRFVTTLASLDAELARLSAAIGAVQGEKVPATNPAASADHSARLNLLQNQYTTIYNQRQDAALGQTRGIAALSVADPAVVPTTPIAPNPLLDLLAALAIGLVLGGLAVLLVERFDDRLLNPQSAAEATGSPLVVSVPGGPLADRNRAYDVLHAAIRARHPEAHLLMLIAASARDHPDAAATELGAVASHAGERVLVVRSEADLAGLPALSGNGSNGASVTTIALPSTADALKGLKAMANGSGRYDFAVLSVPSPDRNAAALSLADTARVVLLVTTARQTHFSEARRTAELLRQSGVDVAGTIFETRPLTWRLQQMAASGAPSKTATAPNATRKTP
jgi:capsular polysaccharide biosynthesis protein